MRSKQGALTWQRLSRNLVAINDRCLVLEEPSLILQRVRESNSVQSACRGRLCSS